MNVFIGMLIFLLCVCRGVWGAGRRGGGGVGEGEGGLFDGLAFLIYNFQLQRYVCEKVCNV